MTLLEPATETKLFVDTGEDAPQYNDRYLTAFFLVLLLVAAALFCVLLVNFLEI